MRDIAAMWQRYNELISSIEDARMYDARGEYHGYTCDKCGYITATCCKDKGVSPFVISCPECGGQAMHNITRPYPPYTTYRISPVKYWVRPTFEQLKKLDDRRVDHVLNGGLVLEDQLNK